MRRLLALLLSIACVFGVFAGCSDGYTKNAVQLSYYDQTDEDGAGIYNTTLFYRNDVAYGVLADPSVIYIEEGEEKGWYYCYGTSSGTAGRGFLCAKSKDLCHWETVGTAFIPDGTKNWANNATYWAPEIMYYKTPEQKANGEPGKYYLYYSAQVKPGAKNALGEVNLNAKEGFIRKQEWNQCIGVAVSDSPAGPFEQFNGYNLDGEYIDDETILFTHLTDKLWEQRSSNNIAGNAYIREYDVHPWQDPKTGDMYLYFASGVKNPDPGVPEIWGIKMRDPVTPDYDTLSYLCAYQKTTVDSKMNDFGVHDESNVLEGPHMYYRDGVYYLTYSTSAFGGPAYRVNVAVAKSPLGPYVKPSVEQGNPILGAEFTWGNISGTGHHSFVEVGDQLMMVYHEHQNRQGGGVRCIGVAPVMFPEEKTTVAVGGETIEFSMMHVNGPTWAITPLPEGISGYKNVAATATVSISSAEAGTEKYLNDGIVQIRNYGLMIGSMEDPEDTAAINSYDRELKFNGKTDITFTFDKAYELRAVMVYNSYDYFRAFKSVERVEITAEDGTVYYADNIPALERDNVASEYIMRPGGSATVEFAAIKATKVRVIVSEPLIAEDESGAASDLISISEIMILGK